VQAARTIGRIWFELQRHALSNRRLSPGPFGRDRAGVYRAGTAACGIALLFFECGVCVLEIEPRVEFACEREVLIQKFCTRLEPLAYATVSEYVLLELGQRYQKLFGREHCEQ
jgi:hypothetical protein